MKNENILSLVVAFLFTGLIGLSLYSINKQPQALLIKTAREIFSDSNSIQKHFAPSFTSQFQNAYCSSNICETISDTHACNLFHKTPNESMALKIFKAVNSSAYGWPKVEMNQNGSFQMIYTINCNQNFKSILYGHSAGDCLVFDSIGNVCELINKKPKFSRFLQNSQAK